MIYGDYASLCLLSLERPQYLKTCLDSLIENTEYPYELIVHDDGSTDPEIYNYLLRLLKEDKLSQVILGNPPGYNTGIGPPMQRMFASSHGKYIVKLDADLVFEKGWLADVVKVFETFPEVVWLGLLPWRPEEAEKTFIRNETRDGVTVELRWKSIGTGFAIRRGTYEKLDHLPEFSTSLSEDVTICSKVYPALCLCRSPERPSLELLDKGWLVTIPKGKVHSVPARGYRGIFSVYDEQGNRWRRPQHFHPRIHGDLEKHPIEIARQKGKPYYRKFSGSPLAPLEEIGDGDETNFRLSEDASTGRKCGNLYEVRI